MILTIAYFTNRIEPKIEWFFRSLRQEVKPDDEIHVIFIDYHAVVEGRWERVKDIFEAEKPPTASFLHCPPKPCVWQGPHKLTKKEYFAASNARNTAFAHCRTEFIACIDDLSVMLPGWLDQVRHADHHKYVVMGAYKKVLDLEFSKDLQLTFTPFPKGVDSRWRIGTSEGIQRADGTLFFGCSFALPIEAALTVNGFDERCDGQGAEDYDFGIRLQRAGYKLWYNRNMTTLESEELHSVPGNQHFIRMHKEMNYDGKRMGSDHVMLQRVQKEARIRTLSTLYDLRELRAKTLAGEPFPIPREPLRDWRDGQPLEEM